MGFMFFALCVCSLLSAIPPTLATTAPEEILGARLSAHRTPCFETNHTVSCLPKVWIAGLPKSGTSALYNLLALHPLARRLGDKEFCPDQTPTLVTRDDVTRYFSSVRKRLPSPVQRDEFLLNACIAKGGVKFFSPSRVLLYLARAVRDIKIILILREYPSWLHAAWNYWCSPDFEPECWIRWRKSDWTGPLANRTASAFVALLRHALSSRSPNPLRRYLEVVYREVYEELLQWVSADQVLVVAAEDLYFRPKDTLTRVLRFSGLDVPPMYLNSTKLNLAFNTNDRRGIESTANKRDTLGSAQIPKEAEELLAQYWAEDCQWMSRNLGMPWRCKSASKFTVFPRGWLVQSVSGAAFLSISGLFLRACWFRRPTLRRLQTAS